MIKLETYADEKTFVKIFGMDGYRLWLEFKNKFNQKFFDFYLSLHNRHRDMLLSYLDD